MRKTAGSLGIAVALLAGLLVVKRRGDAAAEQDLWAEATKPADLR